MISYFVRYRGQAADATQFTTYYTRTHAPIVGRFPGIRSLILHTAQPWDDPLPVRPGGSLLLVQMVFDSPQGLAAALHSAARQEAREDFANFPAFDGEVTHEALAAQVVF
jgi:uncharacterized protein (TIGR02118 family)